jgi:hypothetical protein
MGRKEINAGFGRRNLTKRDHFEDLNLNGKAMLQSIFKKYDGMLWTGFIWLRISINCGLLSVWK